MKNNTQVLAENLTVKAFQKSNTLEIKLVDSISVEPMYNDDLFEDSLSGNEYFQDIELFGDWYVLHLSKDGVTEQTIGYLTPFDEANEGITDNQFEIKSFSIVYQNVIK
jgi:hypothetical protein